MKISPHAGKPATPSMLVNVPQLVTDYYSEIPSADVIAQQVVFGTSGHRGSSFEKKFNENLDEIRKLGFDEKFIRKWNYYFSYCEAAFDMRNISVMQMVYTRPNNLDF